MRPYARVRMLTREEYEEPKRRTRRRKLAASKVQRAKIILLSNPSYATFWNDVFRKTSNTIVHC